MLSEQTQEFNKVYFLKQSFKFVVTIFSNFQLKFVLLQKFRKTLISTSETRVDYFALIPTTTLEERLG